MEQLAVHERMVTRPSLEIEGCSLRDMGFIRLSQVRNDLVSMRPSRKVWSKAYTMLVQKEYNISHCSTAYIKCVSAHLASTCDLWCGCSNG